MTHILLYHPLSIHLREDLCLYLELSGWLGWKSTRLAVLLFLPPSELWLELSFENT